MPFMYRRRPRAVTTTRTTRAPRRGLFRRRAPVRATPAHTHQATAVVHHHKRRPSMKDKLSGAIMRIKGSLTHRPGVKAAGTRRMRGTDGRGARTRPRFF